MTTYFEEGGELEGVNPHKEKEEVELR